VVVSVVGTEVVGVLRADPVPGSQVRIELLNQSALQYSIGVLTMAGDLEWPSTDESFTRNELPESMILMIESSDRVSLEASLIDPTRYGLVLVDGEGNITPLYDLSELSRDQRTLTQQMLFQLDLAADSE
jgi:hypothetical protein